MAYTKKIKAGLVPVSIQEFIGDPGTIFYDPDVGDLHLSDGVTPGGTLLSLGGGGSGNGYTGSQGTNGYTGSRGDVGSAGATGAGGISGTTGYTGSAGADGTAGAAGATGPIGSNGVTGYTGSVGAAGGNANTGNWAFDANTMYNMAGGEINNGDTTHGATAGLILPDNGVAGEISALFNTYGNAQIQVANIANSANTSVWTFGTDGVTTLPTNISIDYGGGNSVQYPRIIATSGKAFSVQGQGNTGSAALAWTVDPDAAGQYAAVSVSRGGGDNLAKVILQAQSDSGNFATAKTWRFNETGTLTYPNSALQQDIGPVPCVGNASTVVYIASADIQHTIKLLIQVEGLVGAETLPDTQSCEMIIAKSFRGDNVSSTVYAVVHTSVSPLATFTALWNALTNRVEVICTPTGANAVDVKTFATEITAVVT